MRRVPPLTSAAFRAVSPAAVAAALVAVLAMVMGPSASLAGRDPGVARPAAGSDPRFAPDSSYFYWQRNHLPRAQERAQGLSPFGEEFRTLDLPKDRRGLVSTPLGFLDMKDPRLLDRMPRGLLRAAAVTRPGRGGLAIGNNLVQVSAAALEDRGPQAIEADLARTGALLAAVPERGYVVRVRGRQEAQALADLPFVEGMQPYHRGFKIDRNLGRTPMIQASRARSTTLDLMVAAWPGAGADELAALRRDLERLLGSASVAEFDGDRAVLRVQAPAARVTGIADLETVQAIEEAPESWLYNAEAPSLIMTGSLEETLGARPYHDIGIDGGGLDTNGDGRRLNNGTDAVPPQIVVVTDNGLSLDSVQFAQSLSAPTDPLHLIGMEHRKVQAVQQVADTGDTCDGVLSGSGTHGNIVSGAIAGAPSALGIFASKTYGIGHPLVSGINMDGLARGARVIMQDAAGSDRCTLNELIELGGNLVPGNLGTRMAQAICPKIAPASGACAAISGGGAEAHLHVMPFGVPNFDTRVENPENGSYSVGAAQIDAFLVNNRDYMVFVPVGSQGSLPINLGQRRYPDLFDGTGADNDPNRPVSPQIPPPATAKNIVSVGGHREDMQTYSGAFNEEEVPVPWASRGPATPASLRMAPLVTSVAEDFNGIFGAPGLASVAVFRSRDNDNAGPVEAEIDEMNSGTSFAAAYATGAGAIVRDYFAQGFYPTGSRATADRMPNVSGALVKATLVAGANFLEEGGIADFPTANDRAVGQARAAFLDTVSGVRVGVVGNNEQGYGRIQLSNVLPIPNWPPGRGIGAPDTLEYPAAGILVFDDLGTGEPPINNTSPVSCSTGAGCAEKTFRVNSSSTTAGAGGGRAVAAGTLRVALAWPDPPDIALSGGLLINDLDLEVESPGPDNCLFPGDVSPTGTTCGSSSVADNLVYDGNVYVRNAGVKAGQWSLARTAAGSNIGDDHNPVEAVHVSATADLNGDGQTDPSQLYLGSWRARVKRGAGGASPGIITRIDGPSEDTNRDGRFDSYCTNATLTACGVDADCPGGAAGTCQHEPDDGDGLMDAGGQPFALVIAGPVFGQGSQTWGAATHTFSASKVNLDKGTYGCADDVVVQIFDPDGTASGVQGAVTLSVQDSLGNVLDTERGFTFTEVPAGSRGFQSAKVPVRLANPTAVANNGLLEADTGRFVVVDYADTPVAGQARAVVRCDPQIFSGVLQVRDQTDVPSTFSGGCDRDQYPDADENLVYSVAIDNVNRGDDYSQVTATLAPSGPGAAAIKVLDSPRRIGRLPGGQSTAIAFSIHVDGPTVTALPIASRKVTLTLALDSSLRSKVMSRQSFSFTHALNADKEAFHYSTDFPAGGREVRDLNRNQQIDRPDVIDPFTGIQIPDEDITFSTLFFADAGVVRNTVGEDLNRNGLLDPGEDTLPNGVLDRGILAGTVSPGPDDKVPFSFDRTRSDSTPNDGGFTPFRHAGSEIGFLGSGNLWEYQSGGICGAQSQSKANCAQASGAPGNDPDGSGPLPCGPIPAGLTGFLAGIWHTGDGDPTTPGAGATACDNYLMPVNGGTPVRAEHLLDVLESPIIAKVHQTADARGFPYSVEFQRLALNFDHQTYDDYAGGMVNFDSDIDSDARNCLLCQFFYPRFGGAYYDVAKFDTYSGNFGVDPTGLGDVKQRTFGPLVDPDNSVTASRTITGDETGFSGFTANTNISSSSPIPTAPPDLIPYPPPGAPLPLAGDNRPADRRAAGPVRNMDISLVNYQDGVIHLMQGPGAFEEGGAFLPGTAGNRWQIGIGFFVIESSSLKTDFGLAIDDPVLEWDEVHPVDESQFTPAHVAACSRFGRPGEAAGQQCATLSVDRTNLYECDEAVTVTVNDPKRPNDPSVTVLAASDSDGNRTSNGITTVMVPVKSFTLPAVPGSPGLFRGSITVTSQTNNAATLFVTPSQDQMFTVYYVDPLCDGDADGQAGEMTFDNLDGDGIPAAADKCPMVYDPAQPDLDNDGRGDFCDNCPSVANGPAQAALPGIGDQLDSDADGVGDACDLDDIDFDGVANSADNCPDVYNPGQARVSTQNPQGVACAQSSDRDGDGVQDKGDNCVRVPNTNQLDSDGDRIGDACDGDCQGAQAVSALPSNLGACNRSNDISCTTDTGVTGCPFSGTCSATPARVCLQDNDCPGGGSNLCVNKSQEVCVKKAVTNTGACSAINDDADVDRVADAIDDCPVTYNPAILAGTNRQRDTDSDGLGDACDPVGSWDDDNSGIPDDILSYNVAVSCRALPLATLVVKAVQAGDIDGDRDIFPDSGETARIYVTVQNAGSLDLTNVNLTLNSADPDIACITRPTIFRPTFHAGETLVLGSYGPDKIAGNADDTGDYFELVTTSTLQSASGSDPARLDMVLTLTSSEILGTSTKTAVGVLADLDLPAGAVQVKVPGPDGTPGTIDDGLIYENFETDRDGPGGVKDNVINFSNLPRGTTGVLNDTIGVWMGTAQGGIGSLSAVGCAGFHVPPQDNGCVIDPDNDMDWHLHCPAITPPNAPSCAAPTNSYFATPTNDELAYSAPNSLHWGIHFDQTNRLKDTVRFRQLAAFVTNPINLALFPDPGDLQLSFFHIASMMSNNELNTSKPFAYDYGSVQIQVDQDPNPAPDHDQWGYWDRLVPFENTYDHIVQVWSDFYPTTYCNLTPTDTGTAPPAPRGVHETMCWPQGVWSNCGWQWDHSTTMQCPGPGLAGATGTGNWVVSKFDLSQFLGQRVRIRWIAQSWEFSPTAETYETENFTWTHNLLDDDGWWIDDIQITGAITSQLTPTPDTTPPQHCSNLRTQACTLSSQCPTGGTCLPPPACPATCNPAAGDKGTIASLVIRDANGDGVIERGERIALDASGSSLTAGTGNPPPPACVGGVAEFRFVRDGQVVQDWTSNNTFLDAPLVDASYTVYVRCSADPASCTGVTGMSASAKIYSGDGQDISLTVGTGPGTTSLSWPSRPQPTSAAGYDILRGDLSRPAGDVGLATLACLQPSLPQPTPVGSTVSTTDATVPAPGHMSYYLVGHHPRAAGAFAALGKRSDGTTRIATVSCP